MDEMIQEQSSQPAGEKPLLSYRHKVLIVGDTRMHYWAEDLKEAFVHVGATASVLPLVPKRLEERWFEFRKGFMNFDVDEPVIQRIRDQVTQANPQLILFLDPFGMEPAFFKAIQRDLKRSAILAAWFSDCRRTSWKGIQCFNHIFYSDSSMQESLKKVREGEKKGLKYLPLAVNEKRFQPGGVKARKNKIVFAGSLTETRLKILNRLRLRGVPVEWYGPQTHGFWNRLTNQKLDHSDLSRLYQEFAITLNLPRRPKNLNGINFRVFEVAACQNLLLTKWVPDLELQFDPYEEVVVYRDWDEVPLVFRSMMYDPYRAEDIALNGRKRVIQQHTYRHRVQTILTTLGQKAC
jgi:hypothetical protein